MTTKLLLIDFQNDFITGSLAIDGAIQDVKNTVEFIKRKQDEIDHVVFTADMHPKNHISFRSAWLTPYDVVSFSDVLKDGISHNTLDKETLLNYLNYVNEVHLYPDHCVAGTTGALIEESIEDIVDMCFGINQSTYLKGLSIFYEQYSAMHSHDNGINFKFLNEFKECDTIYVAGEAFDICVYHTVTDLINFGIEGSKIVILEDCTSSVSDDMKIPIKRGFENYGVVFKNSKEV